MRGSSKDSVAQIDDESVRELQDIFRLYPRQFSKLLDTRAIISVADVDGNITFVNDNFMLISGYGREELIGENHRLLKSGLNPCSLYTEMWSAISVGKIWDGVLINRKKSGELYWMQATIEPLRGLNGQINGYISMCIDITDLKLAGVENKRVLSAMNALSAVNQLIIQSENESDLLRDVCGELVRKMQFSVGFIGIKQDNKERSIKFISAGDTEKVYNLQKLFNWGKKNQISTPVDDVFKKGCTRVVHDTLIDASFRQWHAQSQQRGLRSMIALPLRRESGKVCGVMICYAAVPNGFGEHEIGLMEEVAVDISFGIRHLRALDKKASYERQLRHAQKLEAVGQLSAGIAHDFNNILASILGYTDLSINSIGAESENKKLKRFLGEVYQAGERGRDLIKQMLVFSRKEDNVDNSDSKLNIVESSKVIVKMLRSTMPSSMAINLIEPTNSQPQFSAIDSVSLQQILTNLLINARDAIDGEGEVTINFSSTETRDGFCASCNESLDGEFIKLEVIDNGEGMDDELMKSIFEPFFTTKDVGKGSGLGLATVHELIHKLGGHIKASSSPGEGASFSIFLRSAEPESNEPVSGKQSIAADADIEILRGKHVFMVDDEASLVGMLQNIMSSWGMKVTAFLSSEEALAYIKDHASQPDILITDQTMPKITGLDLAKKIRLLRPDVPILIASGYSDKINAKEAMQQGFGFIIKPFNQVELLSKLMNELSRHDT